MNSRERKLIIIFGIVLIVFLIVIVIWDLRKVKRAVSPEVIRPDYSAFVPGDATITTDTVATDTRPRDWEETADRKPVPVGVRVPTENEVTPETLKDIIAVPREVLPAAPGVESQIRVFDIRGENGKFIPEKVIVNFNDTVRINFTAVDGDYDVIFTGYNMMQSAKAGETKILEFEANRDGRFSYYCETCGGFPRGTSGEIIVVK